MTDEQRADLEQAYLLALMRRDAKIWRKHQSTLERGGGEDALSSKQAQTIEPHSQPEKDRGDPRFISEARNIAKAAFQTKYVREHPCKSCGGNFFYTSTGGCVDCQHNRRKSKASSSVASNPTGVRLSQYKSLGASTRPAISRAPDRVALRGGSIN